MAGNEKWEKTGCVISTAAQWRVRPGKALATVQGDGRSWLSWKLTSKKIAAGLCDESEE